MGKFYLMSAIRAVTLLTLILGFLYSGNIFSQSKKEIKEISYLKFKDTGDPDYDKFVYKREVIKFLRKNKGFPKYKLLEDKYESVLQFNQAIKVWYQQNPEYLEILGLKTYKELSMYDASCYREPPEYDGFTDEKEYRKAFKEWMANHPDVPKLKGEDQEAKEKLEREKAAFYNKYFKK